MGTGKIELLVTMYIMLSECSLSSIPGLTSVSIRHSHFSGPDTSNRGARMRWRYKQGNEVECETELYLSDVLCCGIVCG